MMSRQAILRSRDEVLCSGRGWKQGDLVLPGQPAVGRYGDPIWVFQSDRASGRPVIVEFEEEGLFPSQAWVDLSRELAMALLGRRQGRDELARARLKPITLSQVVGRLGVVARWAEASGHGLPHLWAASTVDSFVDAYWGSRLPSRVRDDNPKSVASTRQVLGDYLNLIANLFEYRNHLTHGLPVKPWAGWPGVGANRVAGVTYDKEGATEVIDPEVWWAAVRNSLRILEWAPDFMAAWRSYHAHETLPGAADLSAFEEWAANPSSRMPVNSRGASLATVAKWLRQGQSRWDMQNGFVDLKRQMVAEGRTTKVWWPAPTAGPQDVPEWIDRLDSEELFSLVSSIRDAAVLVLAALSAMRISEIQELRKGCVEFHDGAWALRSSIEKGHRTPKSDVWWVTPTAVRAIGTLERLVEPIKVTVADASGERVPSDHLVCTMSKGDHGRAGLAHGSFRRFIDWMDTRGVELGLERVGEDISAHQFRRTLAVVAAWQPEGHVAVELQLKDTAEVAAGYYANHDRKWFEAYEFAKAEALADRLRTYEADDLAASLLGPGGPDLASRVNLLHDIAAAEQFDGAELFDAQVQAAAATAASYTCSNGWDCAGDPGQARCLAVRASSGDASTEVQPSAGMCFDLGSGPTAGCANVVLDPAVHLAFWDIEVATVMSALASTDEEERPLLKARLAAELEAARAAVDLMEESCRRQPRRLKVRFEAELMRLLERLTDDSHAPGTAAIYRPLIRAQEERIKWISKLRPRAQG